MFEAKPKLLQEAVFDGAEFVLRFPYHDAIRTALNDAGLRFIGAKDHPYYRYWRGTEGAASALVPQVPDLIKASAFAYNESESSFLAKLAAAREKPKRNALFKGLQITLYRVVDAEEKPKSGAKAPAKGALATQILGAEGEDDESDETPSQSGSIAVAFAYHAGLNGLCSALRGRYMPSVKGWVLRNTSAMAFQMQAERDLGFPSEQFVEMEGTYELHEHEGGGGIGVAANLGSVLMPARGKRKEDNDDLQGALLARVPLRKAGPVTKADIELGLRKFPIDEYQKDGVRHLLNYSSALLADDMGLGKTRQSIVAAEIGRRGGQVLVVAPASVLLNWRNEILAVDPRASVSIIKYDPQAAWVVTTYGQVLKLRESARRFKVMICDEAHLLKSPTAKRTRETFDVAQFIDSRMVLTGTPILNNEAEIHTLLRLSGHPFGQIGLGEFREAFGGSKENRLKLNEELKSWMIRRDKSTVLTLPGKIRETIAYSPLPHERELYDSVLRNSEMTALQKLGALRHALEKAKMGLAVRMAKTLPRGEKMIVFCEFKDNVTQLQAQLKQAGITSVIYTGELSKTQRQATVDQFQRDETIRVFIGTSGAAGVGITLVAANWVFFMGMPWTYGQQEQAEDRAFRRGQLRVVQVRIPMVPDTIDQFIAELLKGKGEISEEVVKGKLVQMLGGLGRQAA